MSHASGKGSAIILQQHDKSKKHKNKKHVFDIVY